MDDDDDYRDPAPNYDDKDDSKEHGKDEDEEGTQTMGKGNNDRDGHWGARPDKKENGSG
jgi:hypothetical protein